MQCIRWFLIQPRLGADRSSAISGSSVLRSTRNNDIRPVIHHEGEDSTNSTEGIMAVMMRALWSWSDEKTMMMLVMMMKMAVVR